MLASVVPPATAGAGIDTCGAPGGVSSSAHHGDAPTKHGHHARPRPGHALLGRLRHVYNTRISIVIIIIITTTIIRPIYLHRAKTKFTVKYAVCCSRRLLTDGVFHREFGFDSHEWRCSRSLSDTSHTALMPARVELRSAHLVQAAALRDTAAHPPLLLLRRGHGRRWRSEERGGRRGESTPFAHLRHGARESGVRAAPLAWAKIKFTVKNAVCESLRGTESSATRASQSQIHGQKRRMLSPKTPHIRRFLP